MTIPLVCDIMTIMKPGLQSPRKRTTVSAGIGDKDSMMYVGDVPWHGLGTELPNLATAQEAIAASGLDWTVRKEQVMSFTTTPCPLCVEKDAPAEDCSLCKGKGTLYHPSEKNQGWFQTVREDFNIPLGCMGSWYKPLQNKDAFKFFDAVTQDPGGPKYVTAGSLHNGKIVWILAKLPSCIKVTREDVIDEYILLTHGHDGLHQIQMKWTPVRVVCANTLAISLGSKGAGIKFKHLGSIDQRLNDAQDALKIARENHTMLAQITKEMVQSKPSDEEVMEVLEQLFPATGDRVPTRTQGNRDKVLELMEKGRGNDATKVAGTWWALYNGVTEYADHYKPVIARGDKDKDEARMDSVLFGSAAQLKTLAFDLVAAKIAK